MFFYDVTNKKMHTFRLNREERKIVRLAGLGGMLEFYDFIIYGIFSIYFAHQFFPNHNQFISIVQSYAVFILGYIARPLGGIFFSYFGDEYGRKSVLIMTITLMGIASLGIGVLPTYSQIGILAPILLLLLRLVQGLALGGELPSTYVYISESMPDKIGSGFGMTMVGVNAGLLLGMLANQLMNMVLTPVQLNFYGWRLPFLLGGVLCLVSYKIRKTLHETAAFKKIHDIPAFPLGWLLIHHFSKVLAGTTITSIMAALVVVVIVFMPTWLNEMLKMDSQFISRIMPIVMIFNLASIYGTGQLANRFSLKIIFWLLLMLSVILIPVSYWLIGDNKLLTSLGLIFLGILEGMAAMIVPAILSKLFPAEIRLTGVALCYNIGFTVFGGLGPVIISGLISGGWNALLTPVMYLLCVVAVSSSAIFFWPASNPVNILCRGK